MMDMFEKSVQKVNDARYQTGLTTLENHYKNVGQSLVNTYLAEQSTIEHDQLAMSQDYYRMLADNRKSMQSAMVDVPQFGPNISPSMFSGLLLDQPQYKGLTSIQLWSQLLAKGVIDEHGMLTDAYQSPDAIASTLILSSSDMDPGITIDSDDDAPMASFKSFLQQELQQFQAWELSVGSTDVLREVRDWVANRLMAHARATRVTGPVGPGLHLAHPGLASFSSSAMIPHVMQFMARASDDFYSDPRITGVMPSHGLDDVWHTVHVGAQHNRFNELMLTPADWEDFFKKFESEPMASLYPIYFNQLSYDDEAGVKQVMALSLSERQEISRVLTQCYKDRVERPPYLFRVMDQLSHIFDGETDPFKDALEDKLKLVGYFNSNALSSPPSNPYGLSYEFLTAHIKEDDIGEFSKLISTLLVELADEGEILPDHLVNDFKALLADKASLFKHFSAGEDFDDFLYEETVDDDYHLHVNENSFVVQLLTELEDTLHYITRSTSDGGGHYIINTFTMDRPPTLRSDYSATIESLLAQQAAARNDMMVASDQDLRNRFLEGVDEFGQRVVVNKIQIESYKDAIRITQEKLRLVFLLTKIMSDALSTLPPILGISKEKGLPTSTIV